MPAPALIHELVERFDRNRDAYRSGQYNETQARREFIDPFFEALGWDVNNRQGYAEAYKDVIHEDAIKIGGATKAPDYCFRIGGTRKFFVEAKKPSVKLRDDISAAFQLRRYAWSAKLPLSLLTDFDEFAIYDCRGKPDKSDKPSSGRVLMLDYGDYLARWDEIAGIFSREAILRGSFDKYAESVTGKHGTAEVDDAFLREIEGWRDTLARTIALRNPALSQRALNTAVQATIDRIVFLRICEDRGIEGYGTLLALTNGGDVYARLADLFRQADARYNSGLFHFAAEGDRPETPDGWTLGLAIDDKPLREILRGLYYPDSPYEFAVLPADILGQVYEQFLGQVIRLTAGHRAVVEAKPEVKKAGGVFYTPTFIVRVIVRRTVGPLLAGKTVREVAGRGGVTPPLRIADIACGSGTFLLEVYQHLLDWYLEQYVAHLAPLLRAGHAATSSEVRALLPDSEPAPAGEAGAQDRWLAADLRGRGRLRDRGRRVAADHGRAEAHPDDAHLRRGHRPAGRGGDQAVAAVEGVGRGERADVGQPASSVPGARPARSGAQHQVRQLADRAGVPGRGAVGPAGRRGALPDQRVRLGRGVPGGVWG